MYGPKTVKNTPKGRGKLPKKLRSYELLDRGGNVLHHGIATDLQDEVMRHHYKLVPFHYVRYEVVSDNTIIPVEDLLKDEIARLEREGDEQGRYREKGKEHHGSRLKMLREKLKRMELNE